MWIGVRRVAMMRLDVVRIIRDLCYPVFLLQMLVNKYSHALSLGSEVDCPVAESLINQFVCCDFRLLITVLGFSKFAMGL